MDYLSINVIQLHSMLVLMIGLLHIVSGGKCPSEMNYLTLEPDELVVKHGDLVQVNCSTLEMADGIQWLATEGSAHKEYAQFVIWKVDRLLSWDPQPQCNISFSETSWCSTKLTLIVYKLPDVVSISPLNHTGPMVEGTEYQLQCDVLNVAPVQNLTVTWYRGNETIKTDSYSDQSRTPVNGSSILTITPSREDDGALYRCEAQLNLGPEGPHPSPVKTSEHHHMSVHLGITGLYSLEMNPSRLVVRYGDSVSVNCSTSVADLDSMGWEASQGGTGLVEDVRWVMWTVESLEDWNGSPKCFINLKNGDQHMEILGVTLYQLPDIVSISPLNHTGPMVEGTEYQLQCDVLNVAPVRNLTVTWYRGNETIKTDSYSDQSNLTTPVNESYILTITPSREDDGALYRCEAQLNLGPEGPHPSAIDSYFNLTVLYKPVIRKCPHSFAGEEHTFSLDMNICSAEGNPRPHVQWYLQGRRLNSSELLTRRNSGEYVFTATNDHGTVNSTVNVTVEYAPEFLSGEDTLELSEGGDESLVCSAEGNPPPVLQWTYDDAAGNVHVTTEGQQSKLYISAIKSRTSSIMCNATNMLGSISQIITIVLKMPATTPRTSGTVMVATTAKPKDKPVIHKCPRSFAGKEHTFSLDMNICSAEGNPRPHVQWYLQGRRLNSSELLTRRNSGEYVFTATNDHGTVNSTVNVTVEYAPELICSVHYEGEEGKNHNLICSAGGMPPPSIIWSKDGKEVDLPVRLTRKYSGEYNVSAINKHGTSYLKTDVNILYAPEFLSGEDTLELSEGGDESLVCSAEGNPPPNLEWTYDDAAGNVHVTTGGRQSTVRITGATSTNTGSYICTATNRVGTATRVITVMMREPYSATVYYILIIVLILCFMSIIIIAVKHHSKKQGRYIFTPIPRETGEQTQSTDLPLNTLSQTANGSH